MKPVTCKYIEAVKCWDGEDSARARVDSAGMGRRCMGRVTSGHERPNSLAPAVTNPAWSRRVGRFLAAVADFTVCQALAVGTNGRAIPHNLVAVLRVARGMCRRQEVGPSVPGDQKGGDRDGASDAPNEFLVHANPLFRSNVIPQDRMKIAPCMRM